MADTGGKEQPERYAQDTEFVLLDILIEALQAQTFIDVGAEKGAFARFFMEKGLQGVLFEPFPRHHAALQALTEGNPSRMLPYAIDREDRPATLHLSYDNEGVLHDHFHSLIPLHGDPRVHHQDAIPVQCRSLESLHEEGLFDAHVGVLKIDTEGNDLNVLRGMGAVRAEVLLCEFFTEGLYAGWEEAHPEGLIAEAKRLGYRHYLAIKKYRGRELLSWAPAAFASEQWGNLLFMEEPIFEQCLDALQQVVVAREAVLFAGNPSSRVDRQGGASYYAGPEWQALQAEVQHLHTICEERLLLIERLHAEAAERLAIIQHLQKDTGEHSE